MRALLWASLASVAILVGPALAQDQGRARPSPAKSERIDWDRTLQNTDKVVSILAIVIGGIWAYIKFFRGRVLMPRLETGLSGQLVAGNPRVYLTAKLTLKNVGLSRVDIHQTGTALRLAAHGGAAAATKAEAVEWTRLRSFAIFEHHKWIESGETIRDELMIQIPEPVQAAYRLELRIVGSLHRLDPELGPEPARYTWREGCIVRVTEEPKNAEEPKGDAS